MTGVAICLVSVRDLKANLYLVGLSTGRGGVEVTSHRQWAHELAGNTHQHHRDQARR